MIRPHLSLASGDMLSGPSSQAAPGRPGLTLWLFGLTALTLVFASLLLLGPLASRTSIDPSTGAILTIYAIGIAGIGIGALAYIVMVARNLGLFARDEAATEDTTDRSGPLLVAPTIPPKAPLPTLGRRGRAERAAARHPAFAPTERSQPQARPIVATQPSTRVDPQPAAGPRPRDAGAGSRPMAAPLRTIRMPQPFDPARESPRPYPFTPSASSAALQVHVAALRSPTWGPRGVSGLVHPFRGRPAPPVMRRPAPQLFALPDRRAMAAPPMPPAPRTAARR